MTRLHDAERWHRYLIDEPGDQDASGDRPANYYFAAAPGLPVSNVCSRPTAASEGRTP